MDLDSRNVRRSVCIRSVTTYLDIVRMIIVEKRDIALAYMSSAGEMNMSSG